MAAKSSSTLNKFLITVFLLISFLFIISSSSYVESPKPQPPSSADLPKLCNYDDANYFKHGQSLYDDIESCNVGLLRTCNVKEIYQLGDSISDVGNLILEGATTPFAVLPYGTNFPKGPTGRASNGKLMIDYFAMDAGLPLLPPFKNRDADFSHGVNFAVAGATALPWEVLSSLNISSSKTNSSLSVQLEWMSAYFYSLCNHDIECGEKFRDAIFMLGPFGGSDYYEAIFQEKTMKEIRSKLMPKVVDAIMDGVRRVIGFGAKRVVVPGLYSIYRLPLFQMLFTGNPDMYDFSEDLAFYHNAALKRAIDRLNEEERPNAVVVYGDYSGAYESLQNYGRMGVSACCGGGGGLYNFELSRMCGDGGASVCAEPDRCISWDGLHLTQEAYRIMTKYLLYHFFLDLHCFN